MTRGLGIVTDITSDNRTPQETTKQDAPDVGQDGPELSPPGSSAVAEASHSWKPDSGTDYSYDTLSDSDKTTKGFD